MAIEVPALVDMGHGNLDAKMRQFNAYQHPDLVKYFSAQIQTLYSAKEGSFEARTATKAIRDNLDQFIETFLWIVNTRSERQLLIHNRPQWRLWREIEERRKRKIPVRGLVLKPRQVGFSTQIAAIIASLCMSDYNRRAAVMAHERGAGESLMRTYDYFFDNLPDSIRPEEGVGSRTGKKLIFGLLHGSIEVLAANESGGDIAGRTGRSNTYHYLHLSEVPYWDNPYATMNALFQTVPDGEDTLILLESTPKGAGDPFHQEWERAEAGKSDYFTFFVPWFEMEEYKSAFLTPEDRTDFLGALNDAADGEFGNERYLIETYNVTPEQLNWRRRCIRNRCHGDVQTFRREYPSSAAEAFEKAGGNFISVEVMNTYRAQVKEPAFVGDMGNEKGAMGIERPVLQPRRDGWVEVWETPLPFTEYIIGTDNSEELESGDYSVGIVLKRMPLKVVARLRGRDMRRPTLAEFSLQLALGAVYFNNAWLCLENNFGALVTATLIGSPPVGYGYRNVIYEKDIGWGDFFLSRRPDRVGYHMSSKARRMAQNLIREFYVDEEGECPDGLLISESANLILDDRGLARAPNKGVRRPRSMPESGYYDDCVFALAACLLAHNSLPTPKLPKHRENEWVVSQTIKDAEAWKSRIGLDSPGREYLNWV